MSSALSAPGLKPNVYVDNMGLLGWGPVAMADELVSVTKKFKDRRLGTHEYQKGIISL